MWDRTDQDEIVSLTGIVDDAIALVNIEEKEVQVCALRVIIHWMPTPLVTVYYPARKPPPL